ncbi:MAG: magnesium transporter [Puniceicoccaceae bacterium]|nr:MAG: magnesium transporter [Puniceicoccaceae bacterium]
MILLPEKLHAYRHQMEAALVAGEVDKAVSAAVHLSVGRCATILGNAPRESIIPCLQKMPVARAGEILGRLPRLLSAELLSDVSEEVALHLLQEVPVDRVADICPHLDKARRERFLAHLSEDTRQEVERLEAYPPEVAGAIMTTDFFAVNIGASVGDTLAAIESLPVHHEQRSDIYVIDDQSHPVGIVTLRELLPYPVETSISSVMSRKLAVVPDQHPVKDAARMVLNRRHLSIPVVASDGVMIGIITIDDAARVLNRGIADHFSALAAVSKEESFFTPPMGSVRMRLPWMSLNIFLNLGAVFIISGFEDTIAQVALLAAFLPMITDMGGNVGIQALSVSIRSIALGEARLSDFWRATRKEISIGLVNGACLGLLFAVVAYVLEANIWLGVIAGIALGCNVFLAGVVGGVLPFLIKRLGKDPAMMTGPFLTTITDITGVTIYLGLSTLFLTNIIAG